MTEREMGPEAAVRKGPWDTVLMHSGALLLCLDSQVSAHIPLPRVTQPAQTVRSGAGTRLQEERATLQQTHTLHGARACGNGTQTQGLMFALFSKSSAPPWRG